MLCSAAPVEISAAVVCIYYEAEDACSHGREDPGKPPLQLYMANPSHLDPALAKASARSRAAERISTTRTRTQQQLAAVACVAWRSHNRPQ